MNSNTSSTPFFFITSLIRESGIRQELAERLTRLCDKSDLVSYRVDDHPYYAVSGVVRIEDRLLPSARNKWLRRAQEICNDVEREYSDCASDIDIVMTGTTILDNNRECLQWRNGAWERLRDTIWKEINSSVYRVGNIELGDDEVTEIVLDHIVSLIDIQIKINSMRDLPQCHQWTFIETAEMRTRRERRERETAILLEECPELERVTHFDLLALISPEAQVKIVRRFTELMKEYHSDIDMPSDDM